MEETIIGIVILNYNSSSECEKCIEYIHTQKDANYMVILVDNCSNKNDAYRLEIIAKEKNAKLIKNKANNGYSAGNNVGLKYAYDSGCKYAVIINPDVELVNALSLKRMYDVMENDGTVAVCGTDIILPNTNIHQNPSIELPFIDEFDWVGCYFRYRHKPQGTWWLGDFSTSSYCEKLHGCCFMIRMSFLCSIGFLDEHTFLYCEEPILAKQVQHADMKMYYISDIQIIHNHIEKNKGNPLHRWKILNESRKYYLTRYSGYKTISLFVILLSRKIQSLIFYLYFKCKYRNS